MHIKPLLKNIFSKCAVGSKVNLFRVVDSRHKQFWQSSRPWKGINSSASVLKKTFLQCLWNTLRTSWFVFSCSMSAIQFWSSYITLQKQYCCRLPIIQSSFCIPTCRISDRKIKKIKQTNYTFHHKIILTYRQFHGYTILAWFSQYDSKSKYNEHARIYLSQLKHEIYPCLNVSNPLNFKACTLHRAWIDCSLVDLGVQENSKGPDQRAYLAALPYLLTACRMHEHKTKTKTRKQTKKKKSATKAMQRLRESADS